MNDKWRLASFGLAVLLFASGCAHSVAGNDLDRLASYLVGTFDAHSANPDLPVAQRFVDRRIRLNIPTLGTHVIYQQINQREKYDLYRQRILILAVSESTGRIEQRAYALRDSKPYVDADADDFSTITQADLDDFMNDGCEQIWTVANNGFRGYVDPRHCKIISSRTGKLRAIEAENNLTATTLSLAERGYDPDSGEQLFGTPPGESLVLGRRP